MSDRLRVLLKRVPEPLRYRWHRLRDHLWLLRTHGPSAYLSLNWVRAVAWTLDRLHRHDYDQLTSADIVRRRQRSDRVFIFGSGYSLNDLSADEWDHIRAHDTFGFSGFVHQRWVRVDYHLVRGWDETITGVQSLPGSAREYAGQLRENEYFKNAVLLLQGGFRAIFCNYLVGRGLLAPGAAVYRYQDAKTLDTRPSHRLDYGVVHAAGTLSDCVNLAYLLGWKEIVLVGVDLYDSRYFWGPRDATLVFDDSGRMVSRSDTARGADWRTSHSTVGHGVIEMMDAWARVLEERGVHMSVYNPHSLLTSVLPTYRYAGRSART